MMTHVLVYVPIMMLAVFVLLYSAFSLQQVRTVRNHAEDIQRQRSLRKRYYCCHMLALESVHKWSHLFLRSPLVMSHQHLFAYRWCSNIVDDISEQHWNIHHLFYVLTLCPFVSCSNIRVRNMTIMYFETRACRGETRSLVDKAPVDRFSVGRTRYR